MQSEWDGPQETRAGACYLRWLKYKAVYYNACACSIKPYVFENVRPNKGKKQEREEGVGFCEPTLYPQVSRDAPPPLPGGYKVGEKVLFTGASETVSTGDKLVHGQQGEVTGPATLAHKGKGVALLFPGNKRNIECDLTTVRRLPTASAATHACAPQATARDADLAPSAPAIRYSAQAPRPPLPRSHSPMPREREG